jgi:Xaa-Pro aminopeptidase
VRLSLFCAAHCIRILNETLALNNAPLKAGMTVSNEPGYYADGRFGIRIENVVLVKNVTLRNNFGDKGYLGFENVTMSVVPHSRTGELVLTCAVLF